VGPPTDAPTSPAPTHDHPAPFVLAPMYTTLCLTSLDQVISNRKLRWAGHVRSMDWQVPHDVGQRTSLQRTGTLLRARPHARALADRLQHRQGCRGARRLAELGLSRRLPLKTERSGASPQLGSRLPLAPVEMKPISEQARTERTQSEHACSAGARSSCHHLVASIAACRDGDFRWGPATGGALMLRGPRSATTWSPALLVGAH
jgi:hypothetical protein